MRRIISGRSAPQSFQFRSRRLSRSARPTIPTGVTNLPAEQKTARGKKEGKSTPPGGVERARPGEGKKEQIRAWTPYARVNGAFSLSEHRTVNGLCPFCIFPHPSIPHPSFATSARGISLVGALRERRSDLGEYEQDGALLRHPPRRPLDGYRGIVTGDKSVLRVLRFKRSRGA